MAMKINRFLGALLLLSALISACSNNAQSKNTADTANTNTAKIDTAIVPGGQKSVKNDSLSGDPASKGSADPDAKLPKK